VRGFEWHRYYCDVSITENKKLKMLFISWELITDHADYASLKDISPH
jgi:hypothetical protein